MNGRVLSENSIQRIEQHNDGYLPAIDNLIATIRDRDRHNAVLREQNDLMLSALEYVEEFMVYGTETHKMVRDTIAQVKAITVSKKEESTASEVACEQPTKDSLHVARQNNPTHPTEQINRLAQEVAADMQWREGEKP